jgi:hypothetical protein
MSYRVLRTIVRTNSKHGDALHRENPMDIEEELG